MSTDQSRSAISPAGKLDDWSGSLNDHKGVRPAGYTYRKVWLDACDTQPE